MDQAMSARFLKPLKDRIYLMLARAILRGVSDEGSRQFVQIGALKGETRDGVERVQEYGFTSHPISGAQAVMISIGGNRDHPVVIAVDDPRFRHTGLEAGEVCLYTDEGDTIILKRGRTIEITTDNLVVKASEKVRIETPVFKVTGEIEDRCDTDGRSMRSMREIYDTHTHPENDSGGPTDEPNQQMGV